MGALNKLYATYGKDVEFFVVYIREAHAADSSWPDRSLSVMTPKTILERAEVAKTCTTKLGIELPLLIDSIKNTVERDYRAWPDRLFLVGKDGTIAYRGGRGPWGFKPKALKQAIDAELAKNEPAAQSAKPAEAKTTNNKPARWF